MNEFNNFLVSGTKGSAVYNDYKELMLRFVTILCNGDKEYKKMLPDYVKKKYYPIEECLKVC